jgi:CBS domain-containing protein
MQTAKDLLKTKTKEVWSISPKKTVFDALKLMADKEVGALIVMDDNSPVGKEKVLGIITERDYARKVILKGKASSKALVSEIMTPADKVYSVKPDTSVDDCMVLMTGKRVRHIPVFDGTHLDRRCRKIHYLFKGYADRAPEQLHQRHILIGNAVRSVSCDVNHDKALNLAGLPRREAGHTQI